MGTLCDDEGSRRPHLRSNRLVHRKPGTLPYFIELLSRRFDAPSAYWRPRSRQRGNTNSSNSHATLITTITSAPNSMKGPHAVSEYYLKPRQSEPGKQYGAGHEEGEKSAHRASLHVREKV
jgi:hypothetical protein